MASTVVVVIVVDGKEDVAIDIADGGRRRPKPKPEAETEDDSVSDSDKGEGAKHCPSSGVSWFEVGGVGDKYCGCVVINMGLGLAGIVAAALLFPVGLQLGVEDLEREEEGEGTEEEEEADSCLRRRMLYRFLAAREVRPGK